LRRNRIFRQAEIEQVVSGDHEQVVRDPCAIDDELRVSDRSQAILVRGRTVVVDDHTASSRPFVEARRFL
jgi:hypothetical protein